MDREFKKVLIVGTLLLVGGVTALLVQASEGLEAGPPMDPATTPAAPEKATHIFIKPLKKAHRSTLRVMARAAQPMMSYSRHGLARLLPSKKHLPDHLAHTDHWDYPGPLQWVPRGWTTYNWGRPVMLLGNQEKVKDGAPMPIGERGSFQVSVYPDLPPPFCWVPVYFAFTLPNGLHFRVGARWDDVDAYVNLPSIAIKKRVK